MVAMIVIGADTHKRSRALAAVEAGTGVLAADLQISADEDGRRRALRWARSLADERLWAIEDCRGISSRLERALLAAGERVVRVAPKADGRVPARRAPARQVRSDRRPRDRAR